MFTAGALVFDSLVFLAVEVTDSASDNLDSGTDAPRSAHEYFTGDYFTGSFSRSSSHGS